MVKLNNKSFTGCWTCRSRKVKCDEQKPHCQKCIQRDLECEGYGLRLTWVVGSGEDGLDSLLGNQEETNTASPNRRRSRRASPNRRGRRAVELVVTGPSRRWTSPEIDAMLERIDTCPDGASKSEAGGFSVFTARAQSRSETPTGPTPRRLTPSDTSSGGQFPRDFRSAHSTSQPPTGPQPDLASATDRCLMHGSASLTELQPLPDSPGPAFSGFSPGPQIPAKPLGDIGNTEIIRNSTYESSTSIGIRTGAIGSNGPQSDSLSKTPAPRHLDLLQVPASQKRLLHHWVAYTSRKVALIDGPLNPCRTMMLPMALRGLMSGSDTSTSDIATFHGICACAAYNLFELGGRKESHDYELAWTHDQQALRYLSHNLTQADQHRDQSFAMAIMACITIDAISGRTCRWRVHLKGGLAYLDNLVARATEMDSSSAFQTHLVAMAILCGHQVPPEYKRFLDGHKTTELTFPYYGVTNSFLQNLDRMNELIAAEGLPSPRDLDAFELQLYLNFPSTTESTLSQTQATMLQHMTQAFYYASLVFFQRSVRGQPLDTVQEMVENGVTQLEGIESVSNGTAGCIMLWPAIVLGAECGTPAVQSRMKAWFRAKQRLGFRNNVVIGELVQTVWDSRALGDDAVDWRALIDKEQFDVFRI